MENFKITIDYQSYAIYYIYKYIKKYEMINMRVFQRLSLKILPDSLLNIHFPSPDYCNNIFNMTFIQCVSKTEQISCY